MSRFEHIAVLMGGPSAERDVSLRSGAAVARGLRAAGYRTEEIDLTAAELPETLEADAVFIALHGDFGEDGGVQALLEARQMPYTGSNVASSRLAFDKLASKKTFIDAGLLTPDYQSVTQLADLSLPLPAVFKPPCQGSSIGIHCVQTDADLATAWADTRRYAEQVLVEQYIDGRELTVSIVAGEAMPVVEICAPAGNYDYQAKYTPGMTNYRVPAPIPAHVAAACQQQALRAFEALGCFGLGRVDFRMTPTEELFILEVNTIPGFTETSLLPKAAAAHGWAFPDLCDRIIKLARVHG
jgi:D-alanine-D-alanine ligase